MAKQQFYIQREGSVAGPYDLVQMAGLLRKNIISRETQTRLDSEDAWMPLSWQPQFPIIREMSPNAESMHLDDLNEEAMNRRSPIPLPSREILVQLAAFAAGCLLMAVMAFLFAWLNAPIGMILLYAGGGIALAAQVMILFKMIEEDYWKLFLTFLVPLYDIYFFICNVDRYYKLLAAKYVGAAIALGAALGLAMHG